MCGLNGIFAYRSSAGPPNEAELLATRDRMAARGPDGAGAWWSEDGRIGLGHRRLAIIDPDARASQPMRSNGNRRVIVFNGEIYNLPALRAELEANGYSFQTKSDTETLLNLYDLEGPAMLNHLRGMFALAIWDEEDRALFLARDPFGIKPLYYADDGTTFRFASQVKAMLAGGAISREVDPAGVVGFHLWGSVPEPFTTYAAIKALPAGAMMKVRSETGITGPEPYVNLSRIISGSWTEEVNLNRLGTCVRAAARDSVAAHLLADVEVGVFLSAGIDSGAILGLMRDAGVERANCITLGFESFAGTNDDEVRLATEVARQYGARHTVCRIGQTDFDAELPAILEAMDQPSIDGINTWFAAKAAREAGLKVALSGVGADEMLAGYPSFRQIPRIVKTLRPVQALSLLGSNARNLAWMVGRKFKRPKFAGILEYGGSLEGAYLLRRSLFLPSEISTMLDTEFVITGLAQLDTMHSMRTVLEPDPCSNNGRIAALELELYTRNQLLRDADWAGMAQSIEIRTPFLDVSFLRSMAPLMPAIRGTEGKRALALAPKLPLPKGVIDRTKSGFSVPTARWMADTVHHALKEAGHCPSTRKGLASRDWARFVFSHWAYLNSSYA